MRLLVWLTLIFTTATFSQAQGVVGVANGTGNYPLFLDPRFAGNEGILHTSAFTAQLYHVESSGSLTPLLPLTTFELRDNGNTIVINQFTSVVPGTDVGSPGTFRLRVWQTGPTSYEQASLVGRGMENQQMNTSVSSEDVIQTQVLIGSFRP